MDGTLFTLVFDTRLKCLMKATELRLIGFLGSLPNEYTSPDACYCYTPEPKKLVQVALSVGG
jgi:hypothetical protein